jgi:ankyrin repeat protein
LLLLLGAGANPNTRNAKGYTPLQLAIISDCEWRDEMAATLIEFKADPNLPGHDGETPLITAARRQRLVCSRLLLQAGADPNITSNLGGQTALMWASYFNQKDMVLELVGAGANTDALGSDGRRPTEWAQVSGSSKSAEVIHILEVTSVKASLHQSIPEPDAPASDKRSPRL